MPELPDLDAIVAVLRRHILGATITDVSIPIPWILRVAMPDPADRTLRGETIEAIDRRGKHVLFALRRVSLVVNPMLAGRFYHQEPSEPRPRLTVLDLTPPVCLAAPQSQAQRRSGTRATHPYRRVL